MKNYFAVGFGVLLASFAWLPACASSSVAVAAAPEVGTYRAEIAALVEARCTSCHGAGGSAPFALTSYEAVKSMAPRLLESMRARRMPPWMPAVDCHPIANSRRMDDADIAKFQTWVESGTPEGTGETRRAAAAAALSRPFKPNVNAVVPANYLSPDVEDDYRCFILDTTFPETVYQVGFQVKPGSARVHHALVYAVSGEQLVKAQAANAKDGQPGYPCFAGVVPGLDPRTDTSGQGSSLPPLVGGWVPGMQPQLSAEGVGQRIPRGSRLIVQMHYSRLGGKPAADSTEVQTETTRTEPAQLVRISPLVNFEIPVAAGETKTHTVEYGYYNDTPLTILRMAPHMHLLGRVLRADVISSSGAAACMIDIPKWDFHWQQSYAAPIDKPVVVKNGESVRLQCTFDNSAENQPVIDGKKSPPRNIEWGEGTGDEMCLLFAGSVQPFTKEHENACDPSRACAAAPRTLQGLFGCATHESACSVCELRGVVSCAAAACGSQLLAMKKCLTDCAYSAGILGSNLGICLNAKCKDEYAAGASCVDTVLPGAACTAELAKCGI